jgi:hypothetical protein
MPLRHPLVAATFTLSMLLYVDRIAISTAKQPLTGDLGLTDTEFGFTLSAFALGYALFQTPYGGQRRVLRDQSRLSVSAGAHRIDRPVLCDGATMNFAAAVMWTRARPAQPIIGEPSSEAHPAIVGTSGR